MKIIAYDIVKVVDEAGNLIVYQEIEFLQSPSHPNFKTAMRCAEESDAIPAGVHDAEFFLIADENSEKGFSIKISIDDNSRRPPCQS